MTLVKYRESISDECAEFWWQLYGKKPYVIRPDGYEHPNVASVGLHTFTSYMEEALEGRAVSQWKGEVFPETVIVARRGDVPVGILICSVNREELVGYILSAFLHKDHTGQQIADALLGEALKSFRGFGLKKALVGPSGAVEVESPIHMAVLEAGFSWEENWEQTLVEEGRSWIYTDAGYEVFMGGSLEGFGLSSEIRQMIEFLGAEGITVRSCTVDELGSLRRMDTGGPPADLVPTTQTTFAALVDEDLVGWLGHVEPDRQQREVMARVCGLYVVPGFRRRGIGKVLYHHAVAEMVRQGAECGYEVSSVHSPVRSILHSVGYRYWYLGFGGMSMKLD